MRLTDLKVYMAQATAFIFSFAHVKETLQIFLLVVSIVYTVYKFSNDYRKNRQKKNNDSEKDL
ncbi:hypothetical protein [Mesonia aquimarina]|uniref:hypothetical protein n=1 Tax=Mesonia aquimarina TaxID=1504967 RepID=UPI0013CECCAE|nr:hypothetical protein [Mesonia aquimarina]